MKYVWSIVELLLSIYIGVNWGVGHASTAGGKTVLSLVGVIVMICIFSAVDLLVRVLSSSGQDYSYRRAYGTYANYADYPTPDDREKAIKALAARAELKKRAVAGGKTDAQLSAEQAALYKQNRADEWRRAT